MGVDFWVEKKSQQQEREVFLMALLRKRLLCKSSAYGNALPNG